MFDKIKSFLTGDTAPSKAGQFDALQIAVVALLIRAASTADARFDATERAAISAMVSTYFELSPAKVSELIETATKAEADTLDLHRWVQAIKKHYDEEARITLIEKMWEVVYADGVLDDYEANLLRRVAGLIYVPDRESGHARLRAMARLGLTPPSGN
ncbi:MAG: TerB family tellurite resistance protein [Parvibaculum sp.]|nr:TerB family tellurite resistance protein [Parvibaculum sp.]